MRSSFDEVPRMDCMVKLDIGAGGHFVMSSLLLILLKIPFPFEKSNGIRSVPELSTDFGQFDAN